MVLSKTKNPRSSRRFPRSNSMSNSRRSSRSYSKRSPRKVAKMCVVDNPLCDECMEEPGCNQQLYEECECNPPIKNREQSPNLKNLENQIGMFYNYSNNYLKSLNFVDFVEFMLVLNNYSVNPYQYYLDSLNNNNVTREDLKLVNEINNAVKENNNSKVQQLMEIIIKRGNINNKNTINGQIQLFNLVLQNICQGLNVNNINKLSKENLGRLFLLIYGVMYSEGLNNKPLGNIVEGFDHHSKLFLNIHHLPQKAGSRSNRSSQSRSNNTVQSRSNNTVQRTYNNRLRNIAYPQYSEDGTVNFVTLEGPYNTMGEDEGNINTLVKEKSTELAQIFSDKKKKKKSNFSRNVIKAMNPGGVQDIDFNPTTVIEKEEPSYSQILINSFFTVLNYLLPIIFTYIVITYAGDFKELLEGLWHNQVEMTLKNQEKDYITDFRTGFSEFIKGVQSTALGVTKWVATYGLNAYKDMALAGVMSAGLTAVGSLAVLGVQKLDNTRIKINLEFNKKKSENRIKNSVKKHLNAVTSEQNSLLESVINIVNNSFVSMGDKEIQKILERNRNLPRQGAFINTLQKTLNTTALKQVQQVKFTDYFNKLAYTNNIKGIIYSECLDWLPDPKDVKDIKNYEEIYNNLKKIIRNSLRTEEDKKYLVKNINDLILNQKIQDDCNSYLIGTLYAKFHESTSNIPGNRLSSLNDYMSASHVQAYEQNSVKRSIYKLEDSLKKELTEVIEKLILIEAFGQVPSNIGKLKKYNNYLIKLYATSGIATTFGQGLEYLKILTNNPFVSNPIVSNISGWLLTQTTPVQYFYGATFGFSAVNLFIMQNYVSFVQNQTIEGDDETFMYVLASDIIDSMIGKLSKESISKGNRDLFNYNNLFRDVLEEVKKKINGDDDIGGFYTEEMKRSGLTRDIILKTSENKRKFKELKNTIYNTIKNKIEDIKKILQKYNPENNEEFSRIQNLSQNFGKNRNNLIFDQELYGYNNPQSLHQARLRGEEGAPPPTRSREMSRQRSINNSQVSRQRSINNSPQVRERPIAAPRQQRTTQQNGVTNRIDPEVRPYNNRGQVFGSRGGYRKLRSKKNVRSSKRKSRKL